MIYDEHTSKQFDAELTGVRERVLQMGLLVESQVRDAIAILDGGDEQLIARVIANDHQVNAMEVGIDETCDLIVVRRQPAANDLRMVMAIVRIVTDLERIGDEAKNIAHAVGALPEGTRPGLLEHFTIGRDAGKALDALHTSIDNFAREDALSAMQLIRQESAVGEGFDYIMRLLVLEMMEKPGNISSGLETAFISRALERICDHARNISRHVIYMVKGKDVRHVPPADIERKILEP